MDQSPSPPPPEAHRIENADAAGPKSPSAAATSPETKENAADEENTEQSNADRVQPVDVGVLSEVDEFIGVLSEMRGKDEVVSEVPKSVELLPEAVESMMEKYTTAETGSKFGDNPEADTSFFDSVDHLSKLADRFEDFSSSPTVSTSVNKVSAVLQRSMSFLEDEFRAVLESSAGGGGGAAAADEPNHLSANKSFMTKYTSFTPHHESSSSTATESESKPSVKPEFPGFSEEDVAKMHRIVKSMISAGYEKECSIIYTVLRRNAFKSELADLGFEIISIDDLQKMQWESLEGEITSWIKIVKECSGNLLPKEQKLCESIFPNAHPALFGELLQSVCFRLVNFAEAILLAKQSVEKLFKILDMYEAVRDLTETIPDSLEDLKSELSTMKKRLAEAALNMLDDLENSIRNDSGRTPVPSGAVHPLTRFTMNYLIYACDQYKDTLGQVFRTGTQGSNPERTLAGQFTNVMELLDSNLDMKSRLYKDPSLRYIFLMNNGRYIIQKIKGSPEIRELMGDTWYRKRSSDLRGYHKSYQRETWYRLLQCLSHEKLQVNGKVSKPVLKERFKSFNTMFEDIHRTQSSWVVSDEQLQSELRVSISAVVTPAYRSFLGRFNQHLDAGRQTEKYVKYQPEDIETLIEDLFAGNPNSMARRRA